VSRHQKGRTNLDFTEARDGEWQWHQLEHMQVSTSLQTDNHASTPPLSFLQAGCPSWSPTNSVKALKACKNMQETFISFQCIRLPTNKANEKKSRNLAEIAGKLLGIERGTHEHHVQTTTCLEQVTNDNHQKVGERVTLVDLIKNHVRRPGKQPVTHTLFHSFIYF